MSTARRLSRAIFVLGVAMLGSPIVCAEAPATPYRVATSIYPTYTWARALLRGVPGASVELLTPPEEDPALWLPSPALLAQYQRASLIALNGARFEKWLDQVSLPPSRTFETAEVLQAEWLKYPTTVTHQHGPEGEHSHEGVDGHTWLDPVSALKQATSLAGRLKADLPQHERQIIANLSTLKARLDTLDQRWLSFTSALKASPQPVVIWASHPAYQYLARRYQLPITSLDLDPERPVSAERLTALKAKRDALPAGSHLVLWWEAAPSESAQQALAPLRLSASVTVSPLETAELSEAVRSGQEAPDYFKRAVPLFKALRATLPAQR